jgi:hypothetical protein
MVTQQVQTEETIEGTEGVTVESAAEETTQEVSQEVEETETSQETEESPQGSTDEVKFANNEEYEKEIGKRVYSEVQSRTHQIQTRLNDQTKKVAELNRKLSEREIDKEIAVLYNADSEVDEDNAKKLETARKSFSAKLLDYRENAPKIEGITNAINEVESNLSKELIEEYDLDNPDPTEKVKNYFTFFNDTRENYLLNKELGSELELREKLIGYQVDGGSEFGKKLDKQVEELMKLSPDAQNIRLEQIRKENKITPKDKPSSPPSPDADGVNLSDIDSRELIMRGLRKIRK